jgi:uncharacterized protein (DUF362 family)
MSEDKTVTVLYGHDDLVRMTIELLETVQMHTRIPAGSSVGLKPNLVVAQPPEGGATTHADIAEGIIIYLQDHGFDDITILEGSWVGDSTPRAFKKAGYSRLKERFDIRLLDTKKDTSHPVSAQGYELNVCDCIDDIDVLINLPVLKGHCQTRYTGALKNLKGCIPDSEKRRFHSLGLHEPIARLNTVIKQEVIIMDGICGDPTFEEGGSPSRMHRILYCEDPVLIDSYAASLLGLEISDVPYIARASELGVGKLWDESFVLREINEPEHGTSEFRADPIIDELSQFIDEQSACSSCYAALIHAFKEHPEIRGEVAIGRDFRGGKYPAESRTGIGVCTSGFPCFVRGCPPSPDRIVRELKKQ